MGSACLLRLTAHDAFLTVSDSVGIWPPRTTCRVRPRPRRRCSKLVPWLRCPSSAPLLRARLLVTFSCLRSFLAVQDNGRSFPEA